MNANFMKTYKIIQGGPEKSIYSHLLKKLELSMLCRKKFIWL